MMEMIFYPPARFGDLRFGMPRDDVRRILGSNSSEFKKNEFAKGNTDSFDALRIHVYYDKRGTVEGVEVLRRGQMSVAGVALVGRRLGDVIADLSGAGIKGKCDRNGWTFFDGALRVGAEDCGKDMDALIDGAYVGLRP